MNFHDSDLNRDYKVKMKKLMDHNCFKEFYAQEYNCKH